MADHWPIGMSKPVMPPNEEIHESFWPEIKAMLMVFLVGCLGVTMFAVAKLFDAVKAAGLMLLCVVLMGCAVGYTSEGRAIGIVAGQAELSSCQPGAEIQTCQAITGGALSETAGGLLSGLKAGLLKLL